MHTVIDLDDELIQIALQFSGFKNEQVLIVQAVKE